MTKGMPFISAGDGKIQIWKNIDRMGAPDFAGSIEEAARYCLDNGIGQYLGSSSMDFGREYGFRVDNLRGELAEAKLRLVEETSGPEDGLVMARAPAWAWDTLMETLQMDAESSAFDKDLRDRIRAALEQVEFRV